MTDHILTRAKAYAALVGTIVTVLLGALPVDGKPHQALVVVAAIATAVATYAVPNKPKA